MDKVSVVVTVKNDNAGIKVLLADLAKQTLQPNEIIVIDAKDCQDCTRGEGRNIGINKARNEIIAVTDIGCRPHRNWLEKITKPLFNKKADVVGGFYRAIAKTNLQRAIVPYLAVRWSKRYLPASRSIAFTKTAWNKIGGYPEYAKAGGEDLEFARRLKNGPDIVIEQIPQALVDWEVPDNLNDFAKDICKHTMGNFEIGYWVHIIRNLTVLGRWILFAIWPWLLVVYPIWVMGKMRGLGKLRIIKTIKLGFWLFVVQVVVDVSVIATIAAWGLKRLRLAVLGGLAD